MRSYVDLQTFRRSIFSSEILHKTLTPMQTKVVFLWLKSRNWAIQRPQFSLPLLLSPAPEDLYSSSWSSFGGFQIDYLKSKQQLVLRRQLPFQRQVCPLRVRNAAEVIFASQTCPFITWTPEFLETQPSFCGKSLLHHVCLQTPTNSRYSPQSFLTSSTLDKMKFAITWGPIVL